MIGQVSPPRQLKPTERVIYLYANKHGYRLRLLWRSRDLENEISFNWYKLIGLHQGSVLDLESKTNAFTPTTHVFFLYLDPLLVYM